FQTRTERALGSGELADRQAWGGKLCGLVLRIALTLHALKTWGKSGRPTDYPTIDAETMRGATAWADYLAAAEAHARHRIGETETDAEARRLAKWVEAHGGTATASEAARGLRVFRNAPDGAERAEQALNALVASGLGEWEPVPPGPEGGRWTRRFRLAPSGTGTETPETSGIVEVSVPEDSDGWGEVEP
ncbi:MAG: DUF3987 domain-containing protein, partial [Phycisphaeraceae bacterium]|nr:DUF3987 domain-containing protein [Phycisphaeraceae bacterium]